MEGYLVKSISKDSFSLNKKQTPLIIDTFILIVIPYLFGYVTLDSLRINLSSRQKTQT